MQEFDPSKIKREKLINLKQNDIGLSGSEIYKFSMFGQKFVIKFFGTEGYPSNEASALRLLNSLKMPYVPQMVYFEEAKKYFDQPFMVTREVEGLKAEDLINSASKFDDWKRYANKVSDFYLSISQIGSDMPFSPLNENSFLKSGESFKENMNRGLNMFGSHSIRMGIFEPTIIIKTQRQLNSVFQKMDFKYNLCFGDTLLKNSMLSQDRLVIFDWEYAHYGHKFRDWGSFIVDIYRPNMDPIIARKVSRYFCSQVEVGPLDLKPFSLYRCVIEAGSYVVLGNLEGARKIMKIYRKIEQNLN